MDMSKWEEIPEEAATNFNSPEWDELPPEEPQQSQSQVDQQGFRVDRSVPFTQMGQRGQQNQLLANVPESASKFVSDTTYPFRHPINTAKGLKQIVNGIASKAGFNPFDKPLDESTLDAIVQGYKDRYGSFDRIAETIKTDPVGSFSDVATAIGGLGGSSKIGKVARAVEPANVAFNSVGSMANAILRRKKTPQRMMESATKFSTTIHPDKRSTLVNTMLEEGINPTPRGVDKMQRRFTKIDNDISKLIDDVDATGVYIQPKEITQHLGPLKEKLGGFDQLDPIANRAAIESVEKAFMPDEITPDFARIVGMSPSKVQQLKRNIYSDIDYDKANLRGASKAKVDAQKELGRGARDAIEKAVPEVHDLNAQFGRLLDLKDPLIRSSGRISNRDFLGLGTPSKIAAGGITGGGAGAIGGLALGLLDTPSIKAEIAQMLGKRARTGTIDNFLENTSLSNMGARELAREIAELEKELGMKQ